MAYYRRRTYRRRPYRPRFSRKRTYRRKFSRFGKRKLNTNVYYFKRKSNYVYDWVMAAPISQINGTTGPAAANIAFRLADVPGYTDFTNMYDQYRIRAVKLNLIPMSNVTDQNYSQFNYATRCFSAFDPNSDGIGITGANSIQQVQEYQNSKWTPYNRIHKRYIKPKIEMTTPGGVANVNLAGKQPWLQCADTGTTLHYGLHVAIDDIQSNTVMYKVEATYYMQFARPK